ncbi:ABC-three component system protein [Lacunimicrobium album]
MIQEISSTLATFKQLKFHTGLNLVVAEKSKNATNRQTRNGSGKSSLIHIVHFLLGAKCEKGSIFLCEELVDEEFTLIFDLAGKKTSASRTGVNKNQIIVDGDFSEWPVQPKLNKETGNYTVNNESWRSILANLMFSLSLNIDTYGPTFRSLIAYFIRRESSGAFQEAQKQSTKQQNWDMQVNLSYLFSLDWSISQELQLVRLKEKSLEILKRESKSGALGSLVGNIGELRTKLAVAEKETGKLKDQISQFQVLPEYHTLESEASKLAVLISDLTSDNTLDQERIEALSNQLKVEQAPSDQQILEMYAEIGIILPELVVKQLDDVRRFHAAIIRNRRFHLEGEIDTARRAIDQRKRQLEKLDTRRQEIMWTLSSHGALDQYSRLQEELSRQQAIVEELRKKVDLAKQLDSQETELTISRAQIKKRLTAELEDKSDILNELVIIFEEFSRQISDHEGSLVIDPKDNGPDFSVIVEGKESKGIRNMQIFCFDLTLAVIWSKHKTNPGFLMHDSHLFDGMDSRQVAKAIEIGAEQSRKHNFQYIVCINSDQLKAAEFSKSFNPDQYRNPVTITDATEDGGIFGMRIRN